MVFKYKKIVAKCALEINLLNLTKPAFPVLSITNVNTKTSMNHSKILRQHYNTVHKARESCIKNKNPKKICRALRQCKKTGFPTGVETGRELHLPPEEPFKIWWGA